MLEMMSSTSDSTPLPVYGPTTATSYVAPIVVLEFKDTGFSAVVAPSEPTSVAGPENRTVRCLSCEAVFVTGEDVDVAPCPRCRRLNR